MSFVQEYPMSNPWDVLPGYVDWISKAWRPKVGELVVARGKRGTLIEDNKTDEPFQVGFPGDCSSWFREEDVQVSTRLSTRPRVADLAIAIRNVSNTMNTSRKRGRGECDVEVCTVSAPLSSRIC